MEEVLTGLPNFSIKKVISKKPYLLEVLYLKNTECPRCFESDKRIKASFQRKIKSTAQHGFPTTLLVKCHKFQCKNCGRYFNTRLNGVKKWSRSTESLKHTVFNICTKGYSNKDAAKENGIGVATVERFYHQSVVHQASHHRNKQCPKFLGIDEHRFTKKIGFMTTFCNLHKHTVFDVEVGRSEAQLSTFLDSLEGRENVRLVCMDMFTPYRNIVKKWFPNAKVVTDRFHVIKLINHHFSKTCKSIDEENLSWGRGGLIRAMSTKQTNLTTVKKEKLEKYFTGQPVIQGLYLFWQNLADLCRNKGKNKKECTLLVQELLSKIEQLKDIEFKPLKTLAKTLEKWINPIARMFHFNHSNGVVEGFHRKMKLIQRRAYGFKNTENYRLRVKVLCG